MKYLSLSISKLHSLLVNKEITPLDLVLEALDSIKKNNDNAIETIIEEEAINMAKSLQNPTSDLLWGIPFAIKDNFSTKGIETNASSNVLNGYIPLFDATAVKLLKEKGAIPIAKTTLDELAMGGSGTTGHKGITYNPYDKTHTHIVGGSSCGSAALVSAGIVPFALGSDTGDSIRKPASYAGLVGYKPTWGRISRYGLFPFAPSIDHVGYFTRNVLDSAILLSCLGQKDENDSTCSSLPSIDYTKNINEGLKGKTLAVIKGIYDAITNKCIKEAFDELIEKVNLAGGNVRFVDVELDLLKAIYPTYIVISSAEATSCNACLDGIKYGPRKQADSYIEVMSKARSEGFSELIKRRFVIGSYSLLKENQNDLFLRAKKARRLIVDSMNSIFKVYDGILLPASPSTAPKITSKSERLSDEFLIADNHLAIGNFGGFPSLTLPLGFENGLPFGVNITCKPFDDELTFKLGYAIEEITNLKDLVAEEK